MERPKFTPPALCPECGSDLLYDFQRLHDYCEAMRQQVTEKFDQEKDKDGVAAVHFGGQALTYASIRDIISPLLQPFKTKSK